MSDVTLTDPLARHITLHEHTWRGHIIRGHRDIARDRAAVEAAVTAPDEIQLSTSSPDCRVYYGRPSQNGRMLVVIADVVAGFVKTAYATRRKKNGVVEWSR